MKHNQIKSLVVFAMGPDFVTEHKDRVAQLQKQEDAASPPTQMMPPPPVFRGIRNVWGVPAPVFREA